MANNTVSGTMQEVPMATARIRFLLDGAQRFSIPLGAYQGLEKARRDTLAGAGGWLTAQVREPDNFVLQVVCELSFGDACEGGDPEVVDQGPETADRILAGAPEGATLYDLLTGETTRVAHRPSDGREREPDRDAAPREWVPKGTW